MSFDLFCRPGKIERLSGLPLGPGSTEPRAGGSPGARLFFASASAFDSAAICEYDGALPRSHAELIATACLMPLAPGETLERREATIIHFAKHLDRLKRKAVPPNDGGYVDRLEAGETRQRTALAVLGPASTRPRRRRLARVALVGARHLSFSPRLPGVGDCGGRGRRKGNAGRGGMFRGERSPRSAAKAFERPPNAQRTDDQALIWDRFGPYC